MDDPTSSSSSPAPNDVEIGGILPIVHVRANSEQEMNELFAVVQNPGTHQVQLQRPLRLRNFPASFWTPPQTGGTKSPSCHSRENSLDNSLKDPFSPGAISVGSPQPQQQGPQVQPAQPQHNRSQSAPVELQQTLSVVQQQQQTQQHVHLRQPSYDVGTGAAQTNNNHLLGPLPPGWEPARTPTGQLYFMNHITKSTQWEDPRIQIQQQISRERQTTVAMNMQRISPQPQNPQVTQIAPPPNINLLQGPQTPAVQSAIAADRQNLGALPEGWEQSVTPEGETYFIHHSAKETSWFDPRIPIQNQSVPIRQQHQVQLAGQQQQIMQQPNGPLAGNQNPPQIQGMSAMQKRQQEERLRRLENERRILQEKANKLQQLNRLRQEQRLSNSQENMQAAVNATQEMLMRQNLNDTPNQVAPVTGMDAFLSTAQQVAAAQNELHNRQESADSGLGMGSNFNLGSIPEDMSMDTDLDTTLTAETNTGAGSAPNNCVVGSAQIGSVNSANTNGNAPVANKMDANELISTVLPGHGEIGLGDNDIMLENMLNEEGPAPIHWL